ncbi:MAG: 3-oxoacyl-ACP synthase [Micavibrio sp.]|nr:MAG: 3-oxoacyl-ACP synthase [Micavibrio sp.]
MDSKEVMRGLVKIWTDFDSNLSTVPLIAKLERKKFRIEDYRMLLVNHRQQVVEGSRWIARAASSISAPWLDQRSQFLRHAVTEHRDYRMLEENYVAAGGKREEIINAEKNIGSEALHAFMYQRASESNPFELLGAMFIIEGLGERKASEWGRMIQKQLELPDEAVSFLLYHGEHDEDHMQEFDDTLNSGILEIPDMGRRIVKTAKIVARLYRLQLEELGDI